MWFMGVTAVPAFLHLDKWREQLSMHLSSFPLEGRMNSVFLFFFALV